LIPERAAVVRRIHQMAANGYGLVRIVSTLDKEKVPAFGELDIKPGRKRSQFSGRWTKPYVALLLRDRRVIGELQPYKIDDTLDGPPIPNYYPPAVSEEEFLLSRAAQQKRDTAKDK